MTTTIERDLQAKIEELRAERNILADRVAELEEANRKLYALAVHLSVLIGDSGFADLARAEMEGAAA